MRKKLIGVFSALLVLILTFTHPLNTSAKEKHIEYKKLHQLETAVTNDNWSKATQQFKSLNSYCSDHFWKYQLYGDKNEYRPLQDELAKLNGAIKGKDRTQSLMLISHIDSLLKQIYSP